MRIKNIFVSITPICVGVMLLLFGFGGGLVRAQETAASKTLPDVYIGGLKTDKTTYQAGETVKGSFIVHNESLNEATDLYYNVGLDGDYDPDGVSGLAYDYKRVGPIVVPGGGQNAIDFTYKLPGSISGDKLGIKIRVVTANDLSLAWRDSMIKVIGGSVGFRWEDSGIKLGGQTFGVQVGPTVYKDKKEVAQIFAVLGNGEKKAVSGRVELRVYNRVAVGEPLFKKDLGTVTVNPGKNLRVESDLPNFNYQPGVYVGEIVVLDPAGSQISALMPFRYLIGGALVNIQNVSLDTVLPVKLGKEVKLRLYYTGNALDLRNLNAEKVPLNKHHLLIEAKNESGAVVARHETDIDFNQNDNYLVNSLASNSAKELSVSILVTGGTTTLAEYKTVFKQGVKTEINWVLWTKIIFLFILLIILLALLKMRSKRIDLSSPTSGVIAALLLLIVPLTIFAGWIKIESRQYRGEVAPITTVTANVSPADPSSDLPLKHGEGFFIRGNVFAPACNNHSQGVRYTPEYLNRVYAPIFKGGYEMDKTIDDSRVVNKSCRWVDFDHDGIKETLHCMFNRYLDFSIGAVPGQPFFAPLTGNSSEIKLKIDNMWMEWVKDADLTADHIVVYSDSKSAESLAYATLSMIRGRIPFTMRGDVPDDIKVSCSVSPNQVALGGSAEWSALVASGTPPYEYHWVFDGVPITANYVSPYSKTYTTAGSKTAKLSVKDSVGKWSAQVDCTNGVNVVPPPTLNVECDGTITNLTSRQVNWRVNKIDGVVINEGNAGAYSYNWSGTDELSGTSYFVDKIYASFGNKLGRVAVQNSAGVAGSCEKVVTLTDSSCTNPPCNSCTRTCPDGYSGPDGCGGTCVPVTPPVCDDSCTGHVCGNTNECGTVCGSPSDSGCSVVTHNKLFCLNFSGLGGLNGDRLNIVEPQKFPVSKTFKVKACECTGAGCLTCTDCSTPYGGTVEVSVPQLGDWAKIISKQASKCSTEEQPSLLPVTIEANSVAGADMTLIFPTRCANNNEASAYNSNPEWNISVSGYDKDYISNKGEGSFKVYFVSSQGSNK